MTQKDLFQTVTSSRLDTRANHSPSRESKKAQKMTATSGRTSLELLHKKDPLGAFSKTFMVTSQWVSTKCSLTWKAKATPRGRLLFQLAVSTLPTKETDSGLWATPNTMDHLPQRSEEATRKMQEGHRKGRSKPSNLREQVDEKTMDLYIKTWPTPRASDVEGGIVQNVELENGTFSRKNKDGVRWGVKLRDAVNHVEKMWPTPLSSDYKNMDTANQMSLSTSVKMWPTATTQDNPQVRGEGKTVGTKRGTTLGGAVRMWPTPVARDHKGGYQGGRVRNGKVSWDSLDVAVQHTDNQEKTGGQLNPMFVEWLMGYPKGWTELKD